MSVDRIALGEKIRRLRLERGLTLAELSALTRVTSVTIHNFERGVNEPKISALVDIALALEAPLDYFLNQKRAGLFRRISGAGADWRKQEQDPSWRSLPRFERLELMTGGVRELPSDHGSRSSVYLVFGRARVVAGDRTANLLNGDALHFESFRDVTIEALEPSLLIKMTWPAPDA